MKDDEREYNVICSDNVHVGRFDIICQKILKNGKTYPYSYIKIKNCAAVLAFFNGKIVLQKQYRHTIGTWEIEIPAGSVENNEDPKEAAVRELQEETGCIADKVEELGWFHLSVGSTTEKVFLYYIECSKMDKKKPDELEILDTMLVSTDEFEELIASGNFHQCMGVAAWMKYKMIMSK